MFLAVIERLVLKFLNVCRSPSHSELQLQVWRHLGCVCHRSDHSNHMMCTICGLIFLWRERICILVVRCLSGEGSWGGTTRGGDKTRGKTKRTEWDGVKILRVPQAQARCPSDNGSQLSGSPTFVAFSRVVIKEQIKTWWRQYYYELCSSQSSVSD